MKKFQKLTALLLCGLLLTSLPACNKNPNDPSTPSSETGETVEKTQVLTNVFKGTRVSMTTEASIAEGVTPYYNEETGETTVLCTEWIDRGNDSYGYECTLVTFTADGTVKNETTFELEDNTYINNGVLTADSLYFIKNTYDEATGTSSYHVAVYSLADGTITLSDDVKGMFTAIDNWFYINNIALDADGMIYLGSEQEIVVLNSSFQRQFSISVPNYLNNFRNAPDGTVYVGYGDTFAPIDKTTKSLGQALVLPEMFRSYNVHFGGGHDLYYSSDEGLYGYDFPEAGAPANEPVLLCSYPNSDLIANNLEFAKIISPDRILLYERDPETYDSFPVLYDRSSDIDLSQIKVLEIAYNYAEYDLSSKIVEFNKENDGVRIIPRDYSVYNTEENNYEGGEQKLINDMLLGLYKPDIVTGSSSSDILRQVYENDLYVDLYPFMETSATVKKDDLLGCVKRVGGTEDGKLWTIGSEVNVTTLMGTKAMLGDRTSWSLTEMLDFAETLPEGTQFVYGLSRESVDDLLLGQNGYAMFIDSATNTCNFECEEFLRYLDYVATLPATYEEAANATAAAGGISSEDYDSLYLLYHNGTIALKPEYIYGVNDWVGIDAAFNTPDVTMIGFPTTDGKTSGAIVEMRAYSITSFCEYPAEAWSFIESILAPSEDGIRGSHSLPTLKSSLRKVCESEYDSMFEIYFDGSMSWGSYHEDDLEQPMSEPGIRKFFTEDDTNALINWLDNDIGASPASSVDAGITDIINEEISSYLAGTKTSADCAKIIQSRVSIWLAEHE